MVGFCAQISVLIMGVPFKKNIYVLDIIQCIYVCLGILNTPRNMKPTSF